MKIWCEPIYWIPHPKLAFNALYQYEKIDNNEMLFAEQFTKLETNRLPLELSYFHPSGFNTSIKVTYIDQNGNFQDLSAPPGPFISTISGEDNFWVFDTAISYRLPNRYGLLTLNVNNLFNKKFRFQDIDPENPKIFPERLVLLNINLNY